MAGVKLPPNNTQASPKALIKASPSNFFPMDEHYSIQIECCTYSKTLPGMAVDCSPLVLSFCLQAEKGRREGCREGKSLYNTYVFWEVLTLQRAEAGAPLRWAAPVVGGRCGGRGGHSCYS